ncbi:MAG: PKD domain-containing protein, partial [Bacteroidales bacterium]|nr:PKD domain-containing protein [Bacteroidales bacterium]
TTTYTLTVTDNNGCVGNITSVTVKVHPPVSIASITTSTDTVCQTDEAKIFVDVVGGNGGPYVLNLNDGTTVGSPFTIRPSFTQTYVINATDMCGSPAATDSIRITVIPYPENNFISDIREVCAPGLVSFTELSDDTENLYTWNFGDGGFANIKNPKHQFNNEGVYTVSLTVTTPFGCKTSKTVPDMIIAHPKPIASFIVEPEVVTMMASEVKFTNYSQYASQYFWHFGDGDSSIFVHPRHHYKTIGEYEAMLIAVTNHNCRDTTWRTILVENIVSMYAPETFSPNGDGINDCFRLCGNGIDPHYFKLSVYDRWGNRVYYTENFDVNAECDSCGEGSWDGTNNGDKSLGDRYMPVGLYKWYCEYKDLNNTTYKKSGNIRLIR